MRLPMEINVSTQLVSTATPRQLPILKFGPILLRAALVTLFVFALVAGPALLSGKSLDYPSGHLHAPNLGLIASAGLVIQLHLATVLAAALAGVFVLAQRKGTPLHRTLGWIYAGGMLVTGVATLFIPRPVAGPHLGPFGPLHLFSLFALTSVPTAIWAARQGKWALHGRLMASLFVGGVGIAGMGAFIPGRLMWRVFFG